MSDPHAENKRLYRIKPNIYVGWGHAQLQDWRDCNRVLEITAESSDGTVLIRPAGTHGPSRSIQFGHLVQTAPPLPSDEPDSGGWIAWHGGECPLSDGTRFQIRFEDGCVYNDSDPHSWNWRECLRPIKAYRVIEPASDYSPDACEECHGHGDAVGCDKCDEPTDDGVLSGAALYRAMADARDAGEPPSVFELDNSDDIEPLWISAERWAQLPHFDQLGRLVRRKPLTRFLTAQDGTVYEWPEPMREEPEVGDDCYIAFTNLILWNNSTRCHEALAQGRCHATHEARNAHERALIAASGGTHE